jgi:GH24 family phage-related lysozyme (muramidase)
MSKKLFDAFRRVLGRGMTQPEVDLINAALVATPPSEPELSFSPQQTSAQGLDLIKSFESCHRSIGGGRFTAYPDPGSGNLPITIGWGSTRDFEGKSIKMGAVWTQEQCDRKKAEDMAMFERQVREALGSALPATSQTQFDALVSFTYNLGAANLRSSTLLRKHRAGDFKGAAAEFIRWNRADGKVMNGLTRRREAEAALYRSGSQ